MSYSSPVGEGRRGIYPSWPGIKTEACVPASERMIPWSRPAAFGHDGKLQPRARQDNYLKFHV